MAITVTVGGNDITAYVPLMGGIHNLPGLRINETGTGYVGTCTFGVSDPLAAVTIADKDAVLIADGGTTLFGGYVTEIRKRQSGPGRLYVIVCQDNNIILEETVSFGTINAANGQTDAGFIGAMAVGTTLSSKGVDYTTDVNIIDTYDHAIALGQVTAREFMDYICALSGGKYYVDYSKNLHYFAAESNAASFNLSTSPNFSTTYPFGRFEKTEDVSILIDRIMVRGSEEGDGAPAVADVGAGTHEAIHFDRTLLTDGECTDKANAILADYDDARASYRLVCWTDGLRAGEDIDITNSVWGLTAETLTIRQLTMICLSTDGSQREYILEVGDPFYDGAMGGRGGQMLPGNVGSGKHVLLGATHLDTAETAVARGDIVAAVDNAGTVEYDALTIGATGQHLESDGTDITWQTSLTMNDDAWIGMGAAVGRIVFDDQATDQIKITTADLNMASAGTGIIHVDGVTAGQFLRADGTRYVPDTLDIGDITDLAYATPSLTLGTVNTAGAASSVIRSDATIRAFDAIVPDVIQCGDAAAAGAASVAARRDHTHGIVCAAPGANLTVATTNTEGAAVSFARSDHSHAITSSSSPGAASLLASDASGYLQLAGLGIGAAAGAANRITIVDGGTIGQAAGPLITFDDTNDYLEITGCNVGIGTPAANYKLTVTDAGVPTFFERATAETNVARTAMYLVHKTSGDMADGFGPLIMFGIEDDASGLDPIGSISAARDGADNSGTILITSFSGGATGGVITLKANGNVGVADSTPTEGRLSIINSVADNGAIAHLYRDQGTVNQAGLYVFLDNVSDDEAAISIRHDGAGEGLIINVANEDIRLIGQSTYNDCYIATETSGPGIVFYEDVSGDKGLMSLYWNAGNPMTILLDYNALATSVQILSYAPLELTTGGTDDITLAPGGDILLMSIQSGATQAAAGALANELWKTNGHVTLPDNVIMIGV